MSKYEFTGETQSIAAGRVLNRIRAVASFAAVVSGDLGGWIETEANLQVYGNAWVYGDAQVSGNAWVQIGPIGSRSAALTATLDATIGIRVTTGCFSGSLAEFLAAVHTTHGDSEHGQHYRLAIALIKAKLGVPS